MDSASSLGSLVLTLQADAGHYFRVFREVESTAQTTMASVASSVKMAAGVASAAMVAMGAIGVNEAAKFESSFAGVRKTVNATEQEFAMLSAGFREMARQIPVNVNEINRIGEAAGQLGIKTENLVSFTRVMADLGVSTNMTSDQAATALARLANITQMSQKDFDRLGATVVGLGNTMATTESEIVEMALRIAGAGKQVGMAEADILSFAAALSSVGVEAAAGGSAISRTMIRIAKAISEGGEKLDLFAAVARQTTRDFVQMFEQNAAQAVIAFIEGLKDTADAGNDVFQILQRLDVDDIRMTDALLRAAGAGKLFGQALETGNRAWRENTALTDEASRRYETFHSQITITGNIMRDIAITVGESLVPILKVLNKELQDVMTSFGKAEGGASSFATFMKDSFVVVLGVVADVFYGWQLIFKYLQMGLIALMGVFKLFSLVVQSAVLLVSGVIEGVFRGWQKLFYETIYGFRIVIAQFGAWATDKSIQIRRLVDSFLPDDRKVGEAWFKNAQERLTGFLAEVLEFEKKKADAMAGTENINWGAYTQTANELAGFVKELAEGTDEFTMANKGVKKEIDELLSKGSPSERIKAEMAKIGAEVKKTGDDVKDLGAEVEAALKRFFGPLDELKPKLDVLDGVLLELRSLIRAPWEDVLPKVRQYKALLDQGKISQSEFNRAVEALGLRNGVTSPLRGLLNDLIDIERRAKAVTGIISQHEQDQAFNRAAAGSGGFLNPRGTSMTGAQLASPITGAAAAQRMEQEQLRSNFEYQMEIVKQYYEDRKALELGATETIEAEKQRILQEMQDNFATLQMHYSMQVAQNIVQVFQNSFEQLAEFARVVAGEQSGIYKAMFFVSRAAAAAMAIVNAFLAYTNAMATIPYPANIPIAKFALASGLAASAAILGTAIASFEGGGSLAPGPRTGGIDGRGGKLIVAHPGEKIIDPVAGQRVGGEASVTVNVHNYTGSQVEVRERDDGKTLDVIVKKARDMVAQEIRNGNGPVPAAIESSYKLGRGR